MTRRACQTARAVWIGKCDLGLAAKRGVGEFHAVIVAVDERRNQSIGGVLELFQGFGAGVVGVRDRDHLPERAGGGCGSVGVFGDVALGIGFRGDQAAGHLAGGGRVGGVGELGLQVVGFAARGIGLRE